MKTGLNTTTETASPLRLTPPLPDAAPAVAPPSPRKRFGLSLRIPSAPPLLLLPSTLSLFLLSLAVLQSLQAGFMAHDINQSGSLRYRVMWLYGVTHSSPQEIRKEEWHTQWREMQTIRTHLATFYPNATAQTDPEWKAVDDSLTRYGTVSWRDANALRQAADNLTNTIDKKLQNITAIFRVFYAVGILSLALTLPWSYRLTRQLRQTQTALQGQETALKEASVRYDQLFEGLPSACFGYDTNGCIVTWNRASETLFGKPAAKVMHKPLWEVISRPENWERNQRIVRDVLAGIPCPDLEWVYQTPGGTHKEVISTIFPMNGTGGIVGGVCANVDITERKRASEALQALTAELQRSNRELASFASVASHDLKEPLRKIETFGGLLLKKAGPTLTPDNADYLNRIISASRRMNVLIDGLLEYGRVSSKPRTLQAVDLNRVASEVVDDLEARITAANARLEIAPLPHVWGDALQMRQLLQNLLSNALKFHAPNAVPLVRVWSEPGPTPGTARLLIADNGIGFDREHAERIFEVFERLDGAAHTFEGSGVGLAICRKIAGQHGGTISAQSQPGKGATFTVVLPTAQV